MTTSVTPRKFAGLTQFHSFDTTRLSGKCVFIYKYFLFRFIFLPGLMFASLSGICQDRSSSMIANYHVSTLYLIPSDYSFSQAEYNTIISTMHEVQAWYQIATGGVTFVLEDDGVPTVINLEHNAAYYSTNYWGNILDELVTLGINNWEEEEIKMIFLRAGGGLAGAAQGCLGECGVGMIGMDLWPEYNSGQFIDCPGGVGGDAWPCTPVGATVHELGHTFGVAHPLDNGYAWEVASHSVMQTHWNYPYVYALPSETPWSLLTVERQHLRNNPFMSQVDFEITQPFEELPVCNIPPNGAVPTAGFNYEVNGLEVVFNNTSSGANLYYWTFGDGNVSTEEDPTYEFSDYGLYTVRLRASSSTSMMSMMEVTIPVCNLSTDITATAEEVCSGETVSITASGGTEYQWASGQQTATITLQAYAPEEYVVTISDANGCYAEESIFIDALPSPDLFITTSTNESFICQGEMLELEVSGADEYEWSTGETSYQIVIEPQETTLYEVYGTNIFDCVSTTSITIEVHPSPAATVTASAIAICDMDSTILTAGGGTHFVWNTGSTAQMIKVAPSDTTIYTVVVSNNFGCEDQASEEIIVFPAPQAIIGMADSIVCEGDSMMLNAMGGDIYLWSNGDTVAMTSVQIATDTSFTVSITNTYGCTDQASVSIGIHALVGSGIQVSNDSVCVGELVTLTGPLADAYQWSTGDTTNLIQHIYTDSTFISLTVVDSNQCTYQLDADVFIKPPSIGILTGPAFICSEDSIELIVQPAFESYAWSSGCTTQSCVIHEEGPVSVAVIDSFGCTTEVSTNIAGDDTKNLEIGGDLLICEGDSAGLYVAEGYSNYSWSNGADTSSISVMESGVYSVTVSGVNGCQNTASAELHVQEWPQFELEFNGVVIAVTGLDVGSGYTFLWNNGAIDTFLMVSTSGLYCLTVTDALGCSNEKCLDVIISSTSSNVPNQIKVYPNPFSEYLVIESKTFDCEVLGLFTIQYQPIDVRIVQQAERWVLVSDPLPSGIYIVMIRTASGDLVAIKVVHV